MMKLKTVVAAVMAWTMAAGCASEQDAAVEQDAPRKVIEIRIPRPAEAEWRWVPYNVCGSVVMARVSRLQSRRPDGRRPSVPFLALRSGND